jgi:hypothetical protein
MAALRKARPWIASIAGQGGFCFNDGKGMTMLAHPADREVERLPRDDWAD